MVNWLRIARGFHRRDFLLWLTLCCHLMVAFGFPLPTPSHQKPTDGVAYPCQSRPCGCLTSEQCWAGDCCCFTLEEKVAWADANGVNPPEHVRPLIESRRSRPAQPAKKKSCCSEAEPAIERSVSAVSSCCEKRKSPTTCCSDKPACDAAPDSEGPHCAANPGSKNCCEKKSTSSVRWVIGVFAQKCRGDGPAGLLHLDPAVLPDPVQLLNCEQQSFARPMSDPVCSLISAPPVPPPRD